jgi:hypothetical protein
MDVDPKLATLVLGDLELPIHDRAIGVDLPQDENRVRHKRRQLE